MSSEHNNQTPDPQDQENSHESTVSLSTSKSQSTHQENSQNQQQPTKQKQTKRQKPKSIKKSQKQPFTGYDSPPLLCILLLGFTTFMLSIGFLITAFSDPKFNSLVQYNLRNIIFKIFKFGNEVADMNFNALNVQTQLVQTNPDGTQVMTNIGSPPMLINDFWKLGDFQIPFKVAAGTEFQVEVSYGNNIPQIKSIFKLKTVGEFVQKPFQIAFLATPDSRGRYLSPSPFEFSSNFIGISPIEVVIYSQKAPQTALLEFGVTGISIRIWWFLGLFIGGFGLFLLVFVFILFALSLQAQSNAGRMQTRGSLIYRAYQFSGDFEVNRYPPLQYQ
ncbi:Transmembrane domain-containing protein [Spironucleus salmonicida]|uniref:Transmembrane domain-containing protein n=1 Tax=Spironucleus salmonicida TaxID=348837 RepID=V6LXZ3_9EUKA|nr:Transmembrane domain-containing protein [Spironucleus salmonicida]|eukprot:EST49123.1 Transmembrane domain-containing protein [Spironucleus salmonicida]